MPDTINQIIENDVQLSQRILAVSSRSFNLNSKLKVPKSYDENGDVVEWQEIPTKDLFPDVFNSDLTVANLTEPEIRAVRIGIDLFCQIINFAHRYNHYSLVEIALLISDKVNNIVVTSRGRNMEAAKLAKTQLQQSMQELFHKQYTEAVDPMLKQKKSIWSKLAGGR